MKVKMWEPKLPHLIYSVARQINRQVAGIKRQPIPRQQIC